MKIKVLGVGSPYGDDNVGWLTAKKYQDKPGYEVVILDRPQLNLIHELAGVEKAIIIDAVKSGAEPGTIHHLTMADMPHFKGFCSSHNVGLADALQLAEVLDALPAQLEIIGIEIDNWIKSR